MERSRAARLGAPLIVVIAVLVSACTSPAGAGVSGAPVVTSTTSAPFISTAVTTLPEIDPVPMASVAADFDLPDITARPISTDDLIAMLPIGDTGPAATASRVVSSRTNGDLVTAAILDRSDETADVGRYRRVTGVSASYPSDASTAHVWIDLFETDEDAAGWVNDTAGDIVKRAGGSHQPSIALASAADYPLAIGQGSIGLTLSLDGGASTETLAIFHLGRIAVFTSIVRSDDRDVRVPIQYLADEVAARVLNFLRGTAPTPPTSPGPGSYEFTFERIVMIGTDRWVARSSGTVNAGAVECSVSMEQPGLRIEEDLLSAGGRLWTRDGSSDYAPRSAAGALDTQLLGLCPAWPIDLRTAGLAGALTGTPAGHDIGGIPALGYRATEADLERALGLDLSAATIQVFNLWVAEETSWLVALDLTLTGEASMLAQLIGAGFPDGGSATVTVSQQITAIGRAGSVTPPG